MKKYLQMVGVVAAMVGVSDAARADEKGARKEAQASVPAAVVPTLNLLVVEAEPKGAFDPKLESLKTELTGMLKGLKGFRRSSEHSLKLELNKPISVDLPFKVTSTFILKQIDKGRAEIDFKVSSRVSKKTGSTLLVLSPGKEWPHLYKTGDSYLIQIIKFSMSPPPSATPPPAK